MKVEALKTDLFEQSVEIRIKDFSSIVALFLGRQPHWHDSLSAGMSMKEST